MSDGYYLSTHVRTGDAPSVREAIKALFESQGGVLLEEEPASAVVTGEEAPPEDDWYGVLVSGGRGGWVSVWVDDWPDSGLIARHLSGRLAAPVLEVWVVEDTHWGYTFYEQGQVGDRFADDPSPLIGSPAEAAQYAGRPAALGGLLRVTEGALADILDNARTRVGQFAAGPVSALAQAVGLPFERVFTAYDDFFEDDPDDYSPALDDWGGFRHLAFRMPADRPRLSE